MLALLLSSYVGWASCLGSPNLSILICKMGLLLGSKEGDIYSDVKKTVK